MAYLVACHGVALLSANDFRDMFTTMVRVSSGFSGFNTTFFRLSRNLYLTIMVQSPKVALSWCKRLHPEHPLWRSADDPMAATLVSVETREVVRCEFCRLMQYRTSNSLCRKCHKPLDIEEPTVLGPQPVPSPAHSAAEAGLHVAAQVRDIRKARHLSQRQLASRMQVPRTYISKIENGKAIPTLGSLERLAEALEVDVCQLVRDTRSRRAEEVGAILADPFLAEIASALPRLDSLQKTLLFGAVRDRATGQRRMA